MPKSRPAIPFHYISGKDGTQWPRHLICNEHQNLTNFRLPIQVCVFLFRQRKDSREYLLLHRVAGQGNFWQGVTGAPEKGETLCQAAGREVLEETGFAPAKICPIDFKYRFPVSDEWREAYAPGTDDIVEHVFVAEVDGGAPTLFREHDAWQWRTPDEAVRMFKWQNNIDALWECEAFLAAK